MLVHEHDNMITWQHEVQPGDPWKWWKECRALVPAQAAARNIITGVRRYVESHSKYLDVITGSFLAKHWVSWTALDIAQSNSTEDVIILFVFLTICILFFLQTEE